MSEPFLTRADIPDGEYWGKMSGYEIEFEHDGKQVFVISETLGVRGINCPIVFRITDGRLDEKSIQRRNDD